MADYQQYPDEVLTLIIRMEQLAQTGDTKIQKELAKLYQQMTGVIIKSGSIETLTKMRDVKRQLQKLTGEKMKRIWDRISEYSEVAAAAAMKVEARNMSNLGVEASGLLAENLDIEGVVDRSMERDLPGLPKGQEMSVGDMLGRFDSNAQAVVGNVANKALIEGLSVDQSVRLLKEVMDVTTSQARGMMRTSMLASLNQARDEVAANLEIDKEMWLATLDSKTCPFCGGRDGICKDEGTLPRPPAHPNCRCTILYIPDGISCAKMKKDMYRPQRGPDGKSTRNTKYQDYGEWLKNQPPEFQDEILGPERAQLLRDGKISFKQMYNRNGSRKTIKQIRKQYDIPEPTKKPKAKPKAKPKIEQKVKVKPTPDDVKKRVDDLFNDEGFDKLDHAHFQAREEVFKQRAIYEDPGSSFDQRKEAREKMFAAMEKRRELDYQKGVYMRDYVNETILPPAGGTAAYKTVGNKKRFNETPKDTGWQKSDITDPTNRHYTGGKTRAEKYQDDMEIMESMLHPKVLDQMPEVQVKYHHNKRAHHNKYDPHILMGDTRTEVLIHEYGHHVEEFFPGLQKKAQDFRAYRAGDEPLSTIYKGTNEKGWKDKFFNHYCGRYYSWGSTEIVSMGLQYMYENPVEFWSSDPEYFNFILDIMWGDI